MNEENLSFHPDDDFSNYINLETQDPLYSDEEVLLLNKQMGKCFDICVRNGTDIYELMGQPLLDKLKLGIPSEG